MMGRDQLSVALLTVAVGCGGRLDSEGVGAPVGSVGGGGRSILGATTGRGPDSGSASSSNEGRSEPAAGGGPSGGTSIGASTGSQFPSCAPGGPGMTNCGPGGSGTESCCTSQQVPGGTFYRDCNGADCAQTAGQATVSGLRIDKYEITVGRFRQFVNAGASGWLPAAGSGKHTYLNGGRGLVESAGVTGAPYEAGWDSTWNANLATTIAGWSANLSCNGLATWTWSPAANENAPINCVDWYEVYAFCIWDQGFLPSDAEWNYAASGGGEQRFFPWSTPPGSQDIDCTFANYGGGTNGLAGYCSARGTNRVGSESPKGDGKWGHSDLGGNVWEWVLDSMSNGPCVDCVNTSLPPGGPSLGSPGGDGSRVNRGGGLGAGFSLEASSINDSPPMERNIEQGARCARAP
jgi:sulfatase modifying factor 1